MEGIFRRYPIGIQSFERLRNDNCVYIDKTELIYRLVNTHTTYFLSRPRRFGKSLLVSTLEAYFSGKKDLFKGLMMEQLEKDWTVYPVLHIDFSISKYMNAGMLRSAINNRLVEWERIYGCDTSEDTFSLRLKGIIKRAYEQSGRQVVLLVDEYDSPMLDSNNNEELQAEIRGIMRDFFSPLKAQGEYLRFLFLTGISKFSQMSIFSELNNLQNISMQDAYSAICGITENELRTQLEEDIRRMAEANGETYDEACIHLKQQYDGYHFSENSEDIYNPFSLLNAFKYQEFGSYWFETGTPTYLVKLLKKHHYDLERMAHEETDVQVLNSIDSESTNPIPVIYQSGYLTIKGYDEEFGIYRLGFPNREVEEGFIRFLLPYYANVNKVESSFEIQKFVREVRAGDYESFFRRLQSFFSDIPYELARELELHYQNVLYIVCKLVGFYVKAEYHTSEGRVDMVLQTDKFIYIMEFKLNGTAEEALQQINDKHYSRPFETDSRKLFKIGVNFSAQTRNIEKWLVEN